MTTHITHTQNRKRQETICKNKVTIIANDDSGISDKNYILKKKLKLVVFINFFGEIVTENITAPK